MKKIILFCTLISILAYACRGDDDFIMDSSAQLEFSLDTLRFDTVFTAIGSATRTLKIYNRHDQPIQISRISIEGAPNTRFRINVDGIPTDDVNDVEIPPNDSIYIFGEVTVDPDAPLSLSPFVIEDNIVFETNGNTQKVLLEAWGQNANYIPNRFSKERFALLSCDLGDEYWSDTLPYVIYGVLFIDSCTLHIPAGAQIYVHGGLARQIDPVTDEQFIYNSGLIYVDSLGKISIEGEADNPVTIQGDRLEEDFLDDFGQWVGIYMRSQGNKIEYATIRNSQFGVRADPGASLSMKNVEIYNTTGGGIIGAAATIAAENCLVYNNGSYCTQLALGGDYSFDYCTFASYGVDASALGLSNGVCLSQIGCSDYVVNDLSASFKNCVIFGSRQDEIDLNDFGRIPGENVDFDYNFENCIVRVDKLVDENEEGSYLDFFDNCAPCVNATPTDTLFVDANGDDYHLDTLSIAEMQGIPIQSITVDLAGNERDNNTPDIGCFEYQYE